MMYFDMTPSLFFYNISFFIYFSEDTAIPVLLDGQRLILANGTLVLRSVKAEDSGYYTCTATNTLGFDTIIVNLLVQGMSTWLQLEHGTFVKKNLCNSYYSIRTGESEH
ncbi:hypothetical protein AMECASPLE_029691 [Ameca splendens]|uniref:Immunoglobulin I-set domain-containing protein n=1 Tax=Ameca splendens TaxID=208324 RepID=A0ABV0ZEL7_9TELE